MSDAARREPGCVCTDPSLVARAGHERRCPLAECDCDSGLPAEFWTGDGWMCSECYDQREEQAMLERGLLDV